MVKRLCAKHNRKYILLVGLLDDIMSGSVFACEYLCASVRVSERKRANALTRASVPSKVCQ